MSEMTKNDGIGQVQDASLNKCGVDGSVCAKEEEMREKEQDEVVRDILKKKSYSAPYVMLLDDEDIKKLQQGAGWDILEETWKEGDFIIFKDPSWYFPILMILPDDEIRWLFDTIDRQEFAVALKGADPLIQEKFFRSLEKMVRRCSRKKWRL